MLIFSGGSIPSFISSREWKTHCYEFVATSNVTARSNSDWRHRSSIEFTSELEIFVGRTALSIAAKQGYEDIVGLSVGIPEVDINAMDYGKETALAKAARNGLKTIVQLLLNRQDINTGSLDMQGRTPCDLASLAGNESIAAMLHGLHLETHVEV